jgi:hypothetical protein
MLAAEDSEGAFMTMTTDPIMHRKHPTFPTMLNRSFRKIADRIVVITTDSAPNGVTRIASTKAYATKLQISPIIINVMPVHQYAFFRYPYPSPATSSYFSFALSNPIFFSTNDIPINTPDAMANDMPIALYIGGLEAALGFVELVEFARAYSRCAVARACAV